MPGLAGKDRRILVAISMSLDDIRTAEAGSQGSNDEQRCLTDGSRSHEWDATLGLVGLTGEFGQQFLPQRPVLVGIKFENGFCFNSRARNHFKRVRKWR